MKATKTPSLLSANLELWNIKNNKHPLKPGIQKRILLIKLHMGFRLIRTCSKREIRYQAFTESF